MTQNANMPKWAKACLVAGIIVVSLALWAYLAGGIMLMTQHQSFDSATPLTLYRYWVHYQNNPAVMKWFEISCFASLAIMAAPFLLLLKKERQSLHGKARFATATEVKKANLLGDKGIIVGKYKGQYLMFPGAQHAMLSAPTRSGKGVGTVIPNLLNWPDSVVVLDIKQENFDITSAFRTKYGQSCYLFNPAATDYRTHRYNPLHYISRDPNFRIDDIQKIAGMLFPDQEGTDPIWTATPRSLFLGVVLMLMETPGKLVTLGQVLRETLADGDGSKYFAEVINQRAESGNPLSGACVRGLNSYVSISSDNTRAGIMTGFRSRLELWNNPLVDAATSANDFDLREVRSKRMSIYIGVTPDNLDRMAPLLNLFFQQLVDLNTRELPEQRPVDRVNADGSVDLAIKYTCLLVMDEFTAIGKMGVLSKGISYIAGYWLRMLPIIQSPTQLDDVYGEKAAETFRTNHAAVIVFPPKATETKVASAISEWLGYNTVDGISTSKSKGLFSKNPGSESTSDQRRALLLPQEVTGLKPGTELVVVENTRPIIAEKITYFNDPVFIDRLKSVSPSLALLGNKLPTQAQLIHAIKSRELGSPVPTLDLQKHACLVDGDSPSVSISKSKEGAAQVVVRPFTSQEIINIDSASLSDFAVDFTGCIAPAALHNETTLDIDALNAYADEICSQVGIAA